MIRYNKLLNFRALLSGFSALMLLASCSSYQYAGYDDDGIYAPSNEGEAYTANDYEESYEDALYYKQLFAEKAETFENVPQEGAIFTDIEGYSSVGDYDDLAPVEEGLDYQTGRPAWGSDPDRISINIYEDRFYNPFYNPFINPYYGGFYDPFLMPGFGYAYNPYGFRYGYGYPYGYGFHSPWRSYGRFGWNWGYRFGHPYNPYYYGGGHYYGNNRNYNFQDVAYSNSRRNSYSNSDRYNRYSRNDDSRSESRIERYSNARNIRAVRTDSDTRTYRTRSTRVRSSADRSRETYRSSDQRRSPVYETRRAERRSTPTVRRSRTTQRSSPVYRSSTPTRSSGTTTRSSSSRSSRGRGN